jgi:broad specificity phosphatase PhoE
MRDARELILIRHGQSSANASGVWQGQLDFPLSDRGREQARLTGLALRGTPVHGFYASPLARAFETAEIIAREAAVSVEVVPLDGLKERRGGLLEGTTAEERMARDPALTEKWLSLPEEEGWELVGAETDEEVLGRFEAAIADAMGRHAPGERVVVVSHGGAMRAYLRDRFGPDVLAGTRRARNTSITRLEWSADERNIKLRELASADHLPPDLRGPPA